jgi:hypothetical protein
MKKSFTIAEIKQSKGCYSNERIDELKTKYSETVTLKEILESEISIKDKRWFVYSACQLSLDEKKKLCLKLAWIVLPIYEAKYPKDSRVKECLQATEDYYNGGISIEELRVKRAAADAADDAADAAAYADAYAAAAAAYAADAADAAAYADAYAAAAAAYAADAADAAAYADAYAAAGKLTYSQKIQQILIDFTL